MHSRTPSDGLTSERVPGQPVCQYSGRTHEDWQVKATMVGKEEDSGKEKLLTAQAQQYLQLSPASSFQSYENIMRSTLFTLRVVIPPLT